MQNPTRLTSRNLFDDVFATIPADVVLNTGPATLKEKYALIASRRVEGEREIEDIIEKENNNNNNKEEEEEEDDTLAIMDISATMRRAAEKQLSKEQIKTSSHHHYHNINIELNEDDEAVQEATKYASFLAAVNEEENNNNNNNNKDEIYLQEQNKHNSQQPQYREDSNSDYRRRNEGRIPSARNTSRVNSQQQQQQNQQLKQNELQQLQLNERDITATTSHQILSAEEQITIMRPEEGIRFDGRCVLFRHNKGFGFITPDIGGPDVYFTRESVEFTFTRRVLEIYFGKKLPESLKQREVSHGDGKRKNSNNNNNNNNNSNRAENNSILGSSTSIPPNISSHNEVQTDIKTDTEINEPNTEGKEKNTIKPNEDTSEKQETTNGDNNNNNNNNNNNSEEEKEEEEEKENSDNEDLLKRAAALLTPEAANLLLLFLQVGQSIILVPENVSFTVRWNRAGGRSTRRLRADNIRGKLNCAFALGIEQAWFDLLFPRAIGRRLDEKQNHHNKNNNNNNKSDITTIETNSTPQTSNAIFLPRYRGTIRTYDADELRGNIRPEEGNLHDVFFTSDSILWDIHTIEPARRRPSEGLMIRYSICGRDKHGRYIATLITSLEDTAINNSNAVWANNNNTNNNNNNNNRNTGQQNNGERQENNNNNNNNNSNGEEIIGRKRGREEEELLLLEEDDYGIM